MPSLWPAPGTKRRAATSPPARSDQNSEMVRPLPPPHPHPRAAPVSICLCPAAVPPARVAAWGQVRVVHFSSVVPARALPRSSPPLLALPSPPAGEQHSSSTYRSRLTTRAARPSMASSASTTSGGDERPRAPHADACAGTAPPQAHVEWAASMQAYYAGGQPYAWHAAQVHATDGASSFYSSASCVLAFGRWCRI